MSMLVKLQEAIDNAEVLKVKYYGGSQPGTVREISPISIFNGKVRARCFSSNAIKTFFIDKIELCDIDTTTTWSKEVALKIEYTNLKEVYEKNLSELGKLGWHINLEKNLISLHRRFKNGKLLKGPDVSLYCEEYTYDLVFYGEDDFREENHRKRQRPWIVGAKNTETRTFGKLDKAVHFFIEQARLLSPNYNQ
ncbi:MAG: hypothetical protein ACMUHX_04740 [bacterium]